MPLRLVSPRSGEQGTDPPKRRRGARAPTLTLSRDELRHVRAALAAASRAFGGKDALAAVLGVPAATLYKATSKRRTLSGTFAIRLAAAAGLTVEAVLSGKLTEAGRCPTCGAKRGGAS